MSRRRRYPTPLDIEANEELDRKLAGISEALREGKLDLEEGEKPKEGIRPCPPMAGSEEEVLKRVRSGQVRPPLDDAELVKTANSIAVRELARRRARHG